MEYIAGEKYWFSNPKAGPNKQSNGIFISWESDILALLYNARWGFCYVTKENLDRHNEE